MTEILDKKKGGVTGRGAMACLSLLAGRTMLSCFGQDQRASSLRLGEDFEMLGDIIHFETALLSASSASEFFDTFVQALIPFGVNDICYVFLSAIDPCNRPSVKNIIFTTYSASMLRQLGGVQGCADDLTRLRAEAGQDTNRGDCALWEFATPTQSKQFDLEYRAGLRNGYTHVLGKLGPMTASIALRLDGLSRAGFRENWPEFSKTVLPMTQLMHARFIKSYLALHYNLSGRERDVMTWLAMGLRPGEIAVKLQIGYRSIDKYIVSAKEKLGANSRDHAVALGVSLGLLGL